MKSIVFLLLYLASNFAFGQDSINSQPTMQAESFLSHACEAYVPYIRPNRPQHNSIYFELAGSGGFASFNYEWNFHNTERLRWFLRAGISGTYIDKNNGAGLIFPVMVHAMFGYRHGLDVGIGQALTITTKGSLFLRAPLSIGYRFEPEGKRVFYRFSYTPIVSYLLDFQWQHWGGITIGYKLRTMTRQRRD